MLNFVHLYILADLPVYVHIENDLRGKVGQRIASSHLSRCEVSWL